MLSLRGRTGMRFGLSSTIGSTWGYACLVARIKRVVTERRHSSPRNGRRMTNLSPVFYLFALRPNYLRSAKGLTILLYKRRRVAVLSQSFGDQRKLIIASVENRFDGHERKEL